MPYAFRCFAADAFAATAAAALMLLPPLHTLLMPPPAYYDAYAYADAAFRHIAFAIRQLSLR